MNKAVIMAGGFGTRLRPLSITIPKPMVPIINVPMMEHIVNLLKKHEVNDIVSVLYFQPEKITGYFEDGRDFGIKMNYVLAQVDFGTAGAVKNAQKHLDERFIIISGDVLTDFDLDKALNFHLMNKSMATILLTRMSKPLQYGIVLTDDDGKINKFLEKPSWGQVFSDTINTGIYILEPEVLDLIPEKTEFDFSKDLFPLMLDKGLPLYGYIADGYWRDIGNLNEYQNGQFDALHKKIPLQYRHSGNSGIHIGINPRIAATVKLQENVVVGNNVVIGEYAELRNCVIGDNVQIGMGSNLSGTTIWNNTIIEDFVQITDSVVCNDCKIQNNATIDENVFIADGCNIGQYSRLNSNIKLWPNKFVESHAVLSISLVQEEKWQKELFTDARISGISNIDINPEFGAKLGMAFGMTLGPNTKVICSRDPDRVSRIMKRVISAGLNSVGVNVDDLQETSIPQTRQELTTDKYAAGFHIRRSPRVNGHSDIILFSNDGRDISISDTKKIERYFLGEDIKKVHYDEVGRIQYPERSNETYKTRFLGALNCDVIAKRKFKILMDYSFGLASKNFPGILGKLGVEALSWNDYVDASRFHPDPWMSPSEDDETSKIMKSLGYELGFRLEAGSEKIALIDERGQWYSSMRLLTIVTKLFLETNKERAPFKIAVSIQASKEIDRIAAEYNVNVIRIQNSHSDMMQTTNDKDVLFVGGVFGGYIFSEFLRASDGMYTIAKILEMLAQTNMKISQLDEELPHRFVHKIEVECPWDLKGRVMRKAMEHSAGMERELIEGVKILFDDDSVLLLPTKEKPSFSIIGESSNYERAASLTKKYENYLLQWKVD